MLKGTIIKGIGGFYYISTENGVYECRARGKFRKEGIKPTVGDIVNISVLDEKNKKGSLDVIEPSKKLPYTSESGKYRPGCHCFCVGQP